MPTRPPFCSRSCAATFRDAGRDIDNCPKNTRELLEIESWECAISGTALTVTEKNASLQFGAVQESAGETDGSVKVLKPRMAVQENDFKTLWYVCAYGTQGGFIALKLENVMNRNGFSMKAEDHKKGKFAFSYVAHTTLNDPDAVPFTFYLKTGGAEPVEAIAPSVE